jgi:hypothetical protein
MLVAVRLKLVLTGIVTAAAFQFNGLSCHPSATGVYCYQFRLFEPLLLLLSLLPILRLSITLCGRACVM